MKKVFVGILIVVAVLSGIFAVIKSGVYDAIIGLQEAQVPQIIDEIKEIVEKEEDQVEKATQGTENEITPKIGKCQLPINYYIGDVDSRFGITKEQAISASKKAEEMWEKTLGIDMFEYMPGVGIPISLTYDERQAETDYLKSQFTDLTDKKERYDYLRLEYDSLVSNMNKSRENFESSKNLYESFLTKFNKESEQFDKDKMSYEKDVTHWNSVGVISEEEYKALQAEGIRLRAVAADLNADYEDLKGIYKQLEEAKDSFNMIVGKVNAVAGLVNQTAESLNEKVGEYNHLTEGRDEFVTGYYKRSSTEQSIDVFQFESYDELVLIIAHELGHSLGIGHATTEKSIMYSRTTKGVSGPSEEDIKLLRGSCEI